MKEVVRVHRIIFLDEEAKVVPTGLELVLSAFQAWMMTFKKHAAVLQSYIQN